MLRPATPLSILLFIAFVLLLLATLSTPIVKAIPLATVNGINLGVFGYCEPSGCTSIHIGYSVDSKTLFGDDNADNDFSLPTGARSSLSSILIVHPVAALLTLVLFIMSVAAHLHAPSHSPRFLIAILVFSIPTLLVTLLAFLVDLLLFVPHLAWGGWIVLASTILILASGIVTCAMRRTLVSRKERKRRIAENSEMNGQNFYANQNPVPQGIRADSPPPLSSTAAGQSEKLSSFTAYETKSAEEDRMPLNRRQPSHRTLPGAPDRPTQGNHSVRGEGYGPISRAAANGMRGGRGGFGGPKDEYGNPLPPSNAFGPAPVGGFKRERSEPPMRRQYSDEHMDSYGARGGRGRGGFAPRGYGRGRPYGQGQFRGGYGQPPARPPPPRDPSALGYENEYRSRSRPGQFDGPGPAGYARSPSAPAYGRRNYSPAPAPQADIGPHVRRSPGPPSAPGRPDRSLQYMQVPDMNSHQRPPPNEPPSDPMGYQYGHNTFNEPSNPSYRQIPSPEPPPIKQPEAYGMIGQAVEMDARHGSPSAHANGMHGNEGVAAGLLGVQQQVNHRESPMSMTSVYSANETYVPPRAAWKDTGADGNPLQATNFLHMDSATPSSANAPIELPEQTVARKPRSNTGPPAVKDASHGRKQSSDDYYEDVDPRFAAPTPTNLHINTNQSSAVLPSSLMPGLQHIPAEQRAELVDPNSSNEDLLDGQRSPASDHSNMTSISQRGINPNWQPGTGGSLGKSGGRKPVPLRNPPVSNSYFPPQGSSRGPPPGNSFAPPITHQGQAF